MEDSRARSSLPNY